jgi:hypothetical protein
VDDLIRALRDADPMTREAGLSREAADTIRETMIAAARRQPANVADWPRPLMFAATVAVTIVVGVMVGTRLPARKTTGGAARSAASPGAQAFDASHERRQLQFATPGGTRIIWVFDQAFNP